MAKKGYLVSAYRSIKDPDKLAAYAKLAGPAFAKYGARYVPARHRRACLRSRHQAAHRDRRIRKRGQGRGSARQPRVPGRAEGIRRLRRAGSSASSRA